MEAWKMGVKVRISKGKLYLDIYWNGRRWWEPLRLSVCPDNRQNKAIMKLAEVCRSKREAQIVSGEWNLLDPIAGKTPLYSYIQGLGAKRTKRNRLNSVLVKLKNYPGGETLQLGQITAKWFENFRDYLLKDCGLKQNTAASYETAIRMALKQAVRESILPSSPADGVKAIGGIEANRIFLTENEVKSIAQTETLSDLEVTVKKAFLFACYTGLRVSDLKSITWGDIQHGPDQIIKRQKKTKDIVYVPLNKTAWGIINDEAVHRHDEKVFPLLEEEGYTRLRALAKRAEITKWIGWHTARHTFAVLSLEAGAEIYTVCKLLGHTDVKTTQVYAKATDKMKRAAVDALPAIELEVKKQADDSTAPNG
jgi:site-specific recombinase XerD